MACRLPDAGNLDEFWTLIQEGRSAVREIPASRLNRELYFDPVRGKRGKSYTQLAAVVDAPTGLKDRYRLSRQQIQNADAVDLESCQVAAEALQHAGLDPHCVPCRNAGVYLGHTRGSGLAGQLTYGTLVELTAPWLLELPEFADSCGAGGEAVVRRIVERARATLPRRGPQGEPWLAASAAPRLISEAFGLDGPFLSMDAACASTLMALAYAAEALQSERIEMAVVGGASYCDFEGLVLFSQAQSTSGTGSRPFDVDADGLIAAEGYVMLVLKTLERALADRDPIQAVIRGIGVASDGRGRSLWAPRREGQIEAVRRAYEGGLEAGWLQYLEGHATSTQIGDATEFNAMAEVLQEFLPPGTKIPLGAVKANIGHTLETAGMAGLVKTVLAMQHRTIPPVINVRQLNPVIDWERSPFFVPTSAMPWPEPPAGQPRRAAVNAFGIGGLNAHVVLDDQPPVPATQVRGVDVPAATPRRQGDDDQAIAVIGASVLAPGALNLDAFWELLTSGRDPKGDVPVQRWDASRVLAPRDASPRPWKTPIKTGGFITDFVYDWKKHKVPPKQIANADPLQFMLLEAVDQALGDAGFETQALDRQRTGVAVGVVFGDDFSAELQMGMRLPEFSATVQQVLREQGVPDERIDEITERYSRLLLSRMPALIDETGSFTSSTLASRITKSFDLLGGAAAIDSSGVAGMSALQVSCDMLRSGRSDMMICAAGQRALGLTVYEALWLGGVLSESGQSRPLDERADGLIPAEGVGVLVLKRLADARRDGDRIRAVIRGIGTARDADLSASLQAAASRALEQAGVSPDQVSQVELAATGVAEADQAEIEALQQAYAAGRRQPLPVGRLAGQIGCTFGASGILALIKAALSLERMELPCGSALELPAAWFGQAAKDLRAVTRNEALPVLHPEGRVFVGLDAHSGDGLAYHVVLERGQPVAPPPQPQAVRPRSIRADAAAGGSPTAPTWRIARLSALTVSELLSQTQAWADAPESAWQAAAASPYGPEPFRLAIVAANPDELAARARFAVEQFERPDSARILGTRGVFFGEVSAQRPQVAFLFPGQGSQYPHMLSDLIRHHPAAAQARREADQVLERLGYPTYEQLVDRESELLGKDVWRTQLSMLVADAIVLAVVRDLGIEADRISGHSYGAFPALYAAGAWDLEGAARATYHRCRSIDQCADAEGVLLSCVADESRMLELCAAVDGEVFVANLNSPQQTVVGGRKPSVQQLVERLPQEGITARLLNVPRPFHTPLMESVKEPFRRALAAIRIAPPRTPLLSSVTNRYVAEPAEILENLISQLTRQVRYVDQIRRLSEEGVQVFLEVGPGQVLTRLHESILADREALIVSLDDKKKPAAEKLARVRAALETAGALDVERARVPAQIVQAGQASIEPGSAGPNEVAVGDPPGARASESGPADAAATWPLLELSGSTEEMGRAYGQTHREAIRRLLRRYCDLADMPGGGAVLADVAAVGPDWLSGDEWDELRGLAAGAEVGWESLLAHQLRLAADPAETVHEFVSSAVDGVPRWQHTCRELRPLAGALGDAFGHVIRVRRPRDGYASVCWGTLGQLGGLGGVNSRGIAVSIARRSSGDRGAAGAGQPPAPPLVDSILQHAESLDAALEIARRKAGGGCWRLWLSDATRGRTGSVEYDGQEIRVAVPAVVETAAKACADATGPQLVPGWDRALSAVWEPATARLRITAIATPGGPAATCELDLERLLGLQPAPAWASPVPVQEARTGTPPDVAGRCATAVITAAEFVEAATSVDGHSPRDASDKICKRFAVRLVEDPLDPHAVSPLTLPGRALILGDNPLARQLADTLQQRGACVTVQPASCDADAAVKQFEEHWAQGPICHLFLLSAHDEDAVTSLEQARWQARRQQGVTTPFRVVQCWMRQLVEAGLVEQASLVACTRLGGDFGLAGTVEGAESGAVCGLVKALFLEESRRTENRFRTRIVDVDAAAPPAQAAEWVCRELAWPGPDVEIAYRHGRRHVVRPVNVPVERVSRQFHASRGPWVITGGARGITAEIARGVGTEFGVKLHLLGSSPQPDIPVAWRDLSPAATQQLRGEIMRQAIAGGEVPAAAWSRVEKAIEIDRNLRSLAAAELSVTYHACDVTDREALAKVLETIRRQDGPIEGVIHGAGFEKASKFAKKKPEFVERTLATKVDGAAALMALTWRDPLRCFVGFGSISGRFGGLGQADYCAANELLCKLIAWYRGQRPDVAATTMCWHLWGDVGMAVRPETKHVMESLQMRFMPAQEGVRHLLDEIQRGCPEAETLITDWNYYKLYYPDPPRPAAPPAPDAAEPVVPVAGRPQPANGHSAACRKIVRLNPAPLPSGAGTAPRLAGPVVILGDNPDARSLRDRLRSLGAEVHLISTADGPESAVESWTQLCRGGLARHVFLMTGRDPQARRVQDPVAWEQRCRQGLAAPLRCVAKWLDAYASAERPPATLTAAVALGGDGGRTRLPQAPEGGALLGMCRQLRAEASQRGWHDLQVKVVDFAPCISPQAIADALLSELAAEDSALEAVYDASGRRTPQAVAAPLDGDTALATGSAIEPGGAWVVAGDISEAAAELAAAVGSRFGLRMHLLQTAADGTGKESGENRFHAHGGAVAWHWCEAGNWRQLEQALQSIRRSDGPIRGIIQAAALAPRVSDDAPSGLTDESRLTRSWAAFLDLARLTRQDPLQVCLGLGACREPIDNEADAGGSDSLDLVGKLVAWLGHQRPETRALTMRLLPNDDSGGLPISDLAAAVVNELSGASSCSEVLIRAGAGQQAAEQQPAYPAAATPLVSAAPSLVTELPLIDHVVRQEAEVLDARWVLDPIHDDFLGQHVYRSRPILPIVAAAEAFAEAALLLARPDEQVIGLENLKVVRSLRLLDDCPVEAKIHAQREGDRVHCRLSADFRSRKGEVMEQDRLHMQALTLLGREPLQLSPWNLARLQWHDTWYPEDRSLLYHGPLYRALNGIAWQGAECLYARFTAPTPQRFGGRRTGARWLTPAVLLDSCMFACGIHMWATQSGVVAIPESIDRLLLGPLPREGEPYVAILYYRGIEDSRGLFDVSLCRENGQVILQVEGYRNVIIPGTEADPQ